jgi:hypothetical protein
LACELRGSEKVWYVEKKEREIEICWKERKVSREVRMTINLIKPYGSRMTDKNEQREYIFYGPLELVLFFLPATHICSVFVGM